MNEENNCRARQDCGRHCDTVVRAMNLNAGCTRFQITLSPPIEFEIDDLVFHPTMLYQKVTVRLLPIGILNNHVASHADFLRASSRLPPPRTSTETKNHFRLTVACPLFKETNQHWLIVLCCRNPRTEVVFSFQQTLVGEERVTKPQERLRGGLITIMF